jgi:hypothetical protein
MYDGSDPRPNNNYPKRSKSSSGSRLHPYQRPEVWEESMERITEGYTQEGKKYWENFLKQMKIDRTKPIEWKRVPAVVKNNKKS